MKSAIIATSGTQFFVSEGDEVQLDRIGKTEGEHISFDHVLLYTDDKEVQIGTPDVLDIRVNATVIHNSKGDKIRVSTYRAKSRYHKTKGFRHQYTRVKIDSIAHKKGK